MATSGPRFPGTAASDLSNGGTAAWANPSNIAADDGTLASVESDPSGFSGYASVSLSGYLKASNFGFAIPTGSTINGIEMTYERAQQFQDGADVTESIVQLLQGGTPGGTNKANTVVGSLPTTTLTPVTYGGASDTWGRSWTAEQINASNFGVAISLLLTCDEVNPAQAFVDYVSVTVHYTEPAAGGQGIMRRWGGVPGMPGAGRFGRNW